MLKWFWFTETGPWVLVYAQLRAAEVTGVGSRCVTITYTALLAVFSLQANEISRDVYLLGMFAWRCVLRGQRMVSNCEAMCDSDCWLSESHVHESTTNVYTCTCIRAPAPPREMGKTALAAGTCTKGSAAKNTYS